MERTESGHDGGQKADKRRTREEKKRGEKKKAPLALHQAGGGLLALDTLLSKGTGTRKDEPL